MVNLPTWMVVLNGKCGKCRWAMKKTWLFTLYSGLYYPLLYSLLYPMIGIPVKQPVQRKVIRVFAVGVVDLPRGWSICTLGRSGLDGGGGREKTTRMTCEKMEVQDLIKRWFEYWVLTMNDFHIYIYILCKCAYFISHNGDRISRHTIWKRILVTSYSKFFLLIDIVQWIFLGVNKYLLDWWHKERRQRTVSTAWGRIRNWSWRLLD